MEQVAGVALSGLVGGVSYFLSLGFTPPPGAEGFKFFATFGGICGFGVGSVLASRAKTYSLFKLWLLIVLDLIFGSTTALGYMLLIASGAATGPWLFGLLAALLAITFFCLGLSLPLAGMSFAGERDARKG